MRLWNPRTVKDAIAAYVEPLTAFLVEHIEKQEAERARHEADMKISCAGVNAARQEISLANCALDDLASLTGKKKRA